MEHMCNFQSSPLAARSSGIGVWEHVLHIVTVIAVLTNCALIAVTSNFFGWISDSIGSVGVVFICIAWEHVMLLVKYIIQSSTNKLPREVIDSMKEEKIKAARRRNESLVYRHRRSKSCLYDDEQVVNHYSNETATRFSPETKVLSTILSHDDIDESSKAKKDISSTDDKENSPIPIPKAVPETSNENESSSTSGNANKVIIKNEFVKSNPPDEVNSVKRLIHRIEKQKSVHGLNAQKPSVSRATFVKSGIQKSPMSTTPIELLQMKKTRKTPPRTLGKLSPLGCHPPASTNNGRMNTEYLSTDSYGSRPTPRELASDLSFEVSSIPSASL